MAEIKVEKMSAEAYAPFGRVVGHMPGTPTKQGEGWTCYSPMELVDVTTSMGIGVVYCDEFPKNISSLERHVSRDEILWTTDKEVLMMVDIPRYLGDPKARPNIETAKIFMIPPHTILIIEKGTWHSPAYSVKGSTKYYFMIELKKDYIDQDEQPWIPFINNDTVKIKV